MINWGKYLQLTLQSNDLTFLIYKELPYKETEKKKSIFTTEKWAKYINA